DALWQLTDPADRSDLRAAADRVAAAVRGRPQRPVEAHLLLMTDFFYSKVVTPPESPPADLWKLAGRTRLLAEQAATGDRRDDKRHPYSELVWPLVRKDVLDADAT